VDQIRGKIVMLVLVLYIFFQFLEVATYIDKKPLKFRVDIWIQMLHMDSGLYGLNVCFDLLCLV